MFKHSIWGIPLLVFAICFLFGFQKEATTTHAAEAQAKKYYNLHYAISSSGHGYRCKTFSSHSACEAAGEKLEHNQWFCECETEPCK